MHNALCLCATQARCICMSASCILCAADSSQAHSAPIHHSLPPCIFVFIFSLWQFFVYLCRCKHLNGNVPFWLVHTLALLQIISFLNFISNADVYFSLALIHAIHDMHRTNNRQTEKLRWRRFDDILAFCRTKKKRKYCAIGILLLRRPLLMRNRNQWIALHATCIKCVNRTKRWKHENNWFDQVDKKHCLYYDSCSWIAKFKAIISRKCLSLCTIIGPCPKDTR